MGDVVGENAQKYKRTSSEITSSRHKARRALWLTKSFWKYVSIYVLHFLKQRPSTGWALDSQEGSGVEIVLKKLVWPGLAAEANFRNICLLGTSRTCVETS